MSTNPSPLLRHAPHGTSYQWALDNHQLPGPGPYDRYDFTTDEARNLIDVLDNPEDVDTLVSRLSNLEVLIELVEEGDEQVVGAALRNRHLDLGEVIHLDKVRDHEGLAAALQAHPAHKVREWGLWSPMTSNEWGDYVRSGGTYADLCDLAGKEVTPPNAMHLYNCRAGTALQFILELEEAEQQVPALTGMNEERMLELFAHALGSPDAHVWSLFVLNMLDREFCQMTPRRAATVAKKHNITCPTHWFSQMEERDLIDFLYLWSQHWPLTGDDVEKIPTLENRTLGFDKINVVSSAKAFDSLYRNPGLRDLAQVHCKNYSFFTWVTSPNSPDYQSDTRDWGAISEICGIADTPKGTMRRVLLHEWKAGNFVSVSVLSRGSDTYQHEALTTWENFIKKQDPTPELLEGSLVSVAQATVAVTSILGRARKDGNPTQWVPAAHKAHEYLTNHGITRDRPDVDIWTVWFLTTETLLRGGEPDKVTWPAGPLHRLFCKDESQRWSAFDDPIGYDMVEDRRELFREVIFPAWADAAATGKTPVPNVEQWLVDRPWNVTSLVTDGMLGGTFLHQARNPESPHLAEAVAHAAGQKLGDDYDKWRRFDALLGEWSGNLPDLLDQVNSEDASE